MRAVGYADSRRDELAAPLASSSGFEQLERLHIGLDRELEPAERAIIGRKPLGAFFDVVSPA